MKQRKLLHTAEVLKDTTGDGVIDTVEKDTNLDGESRSCDSNALAKLKRKPSAFRIISLFLEYSCEFKNGNN